MDGVTVKQHPLIVMVVVLICDLLLPVRVTFPQLLIDHLLNLWGTIGQISKKMLGAVSALHQEFKVDTHPSQIAVITFH